MKIFGVLVALIISQSAFAAGKKYGVVDMQAVILAVDEGKDARSTLEKEIKSKEEGFKKQKEELDKLNSEWKTQSALLSETAKSQKQQEFQEKFMALRNAEMEFQGDIKRKEQKATQKIAMRVMPMVEKLAKERSLEAVFESNSSGLLYLETPVDLTKEVIASYNKGAGKTAKTEEKKPEEKK